MTSTSTQWPSSTPVPELVKDLLHFELTDTQSDDFGTRLGEEIVTEDGTWVFQRRTFVGKAGMYAAVSVGEKRCKEISEC
jgi:hypothetical protein